MNKRYFVFCSFVLVFVFLFLTVGFAAYTSDLTISDLGLTIRRPLDVRITNLTLNNSSSGVLVENLDYNVKNIMSDIVLPENGSLTYDIEFTNYANYPVYLMEITNLPDNLKYEIDLGKDERYSFEELFIENQYGLKDISVTISYKDGGYDSQNNQYNFNIGFYFESSYNVTYHPNLLPPEYQQVEYIESTGSQYIDTKVLSGNNDLKFDIQYSMTKFATNDQYSGIFGTYSSEGHNATRIIYRGNSSGTSAQAYVYLNSVAGNSALIDSTPRTLNTIYTETLERKNNTTYYTSNAFTGVLENANPPSGTSYISNIVIFNQDANANIYSSMKLYYFKIYDGGALIRNFIPCYRLSDSVVGLYDTVTKEFYKNAGSGTFVKGSDISYTKKQSILTGKTIALNKNSFDYYPYIFTSWNTESDGSGKKYKDEQKVYNIGFNNDDVNLYAQWRPYQSEIIFYANGGFGVMDKQITPYGGKQVVPSCNFTKAGYVFKKWNTEPDGSGTDYFSTDTINIDASKGDVTLKLYAQWVIDFLPLEFQQLEYIESSGLQYIDTGVAAGNNDLSFEIQYALTKFPSNNQYIGIFGSYNNESSNTTRILCRGTGSNVNVLTYLNSIAGSNALIDYTPRTLNTIYTETLERKNNITRYTSNAFTGVLEKTNPPSGTSYSGNIAVFSQNTKGSINVSMRLYYFKIFNGEELVRYFIPCYRKSDNVVGLYDVVTKRLYTNKGSGTFVKGTEIN